MLLAPKNRKKSPDRLILYTEAFFRLTRPYEEYYDAYNDVFNRLRLDGCGLRIMSR